MRTIIRWFSCHYTAPARPKQACSPDFTAEVSGLKPECLRLIHILNFKNLIISYCPWFVLIT